MKRRDFFRTGGVAGLGMGLWQGIGKSIDRLEFDSEVKNIIFLVTDGMSSGTFQMGDLLRQRMDGKVSHWLQLYRDKEITRAIMDMASANSSVTDSAAAASSWGGGVRVKNGSLNMGPKGEVYTPIFQKFKAAGKSTGCVTTVPITHATPAGFLIAAESRGDQAKIAELYLKEKFDVLMGGGHEYFDSAKREDGKDMYAKFRQAGYHIAMDKEGMKKASKDNPLLAVFHEGGLPYTLDQKFDRHYSETIPTLAEMTTKAIDLMKGNPRGFVVQVEAGKVDWAAHGNDLGGILYDQLAFDDAVKVAIDFARKDQNTLVIITTDHGNANPGLFSGRNADNNFNKVLSFTQTADFILGQITNKLNPEQVVELIQTHKGITLEKENAKELLKFYEKLDDPAIYRPYDLPFKRFAEMLSPHTNVGWAGTSHSADYVELSMFGPGSEVLPPFLLNTDLHHYMLKAAGVRG